MNLDEKLKDFNRNDFLSLIEESRSYCAQDLRTSLDIVDVNRLPELSRNEIEKNFSFELFSIYRITINTISSSCSSILSLSSCIFNSPEFRNWSLSKCEKLSSRWIRNFGFSSC